MQQAESSTVEPLISGRLDPRLAAASATIAASRELDLLYEQSPNALCLINRNLQIMRLNSKFVALLNLPAEVQVADQTLQDIAPQLATQLQVAVLHAKLGHTISVTVELPHLPLPVCMQLDATQEPTPAEVAPLGLDGWVLLSCSRPADAVDASSPLSPGLFQDVLENVPDGFLLLDKQWNITFVNQHAARLLYKSVEQLLHQSACEVLAGMRDSEFARQLKIARDTNQTLVFDGYYQHVNTSFKCHCFPVQDGMSIFFRDVTQNQKTIQRLRKSEAESRRLAAIVEQCKDFVGLCTRQGVPIYVNRAGREMVGLLPTDDISQRHFLSFFAPECHETIAVEGIPALRQRGRWKGEVSFKNELTGKLIPSQWNVFVIEDPDGEYPEVWATVSPDLSEQKRMEEALRGSERLAQQANFAKSEFLANMSHEIRTPMAAVLGYADILLEHLADPDDRASIQIIKRNGEHLLELINDILDLSRIEAGKLGVERMRFELLPFIGDIRSLMQVRADAKQLSLNVRFDGKVPASLNSDPTRLRQVLINLLGNAIKFTEQGSVDLVIRFVEGAVPCVELRVADTGIGMRHEQLSRLFQPFTQGDSSVTRSFGGSGLGLAISKRLVEMLHGHLKVESDWGVGSSFYVTLPLEIDSGVQLIDAGEVNPIRSSSQSGSQRRLNCHALVVDDRRDVRYVSQHFLEQAGARVETAEDGQRGVEAVCAALETSRPFDIIVLDMQMPIVDGYQAAKKLRALGFVQPIIALTADAMKGDRERCLAAGCDDYLSKPIEHAAFVEIVARYTLDLSIEELKQRRAQHAASGHVPEAHPDRRDPA